MLARRFLYIIAGIIALILAFGIAWSLFQEPLMRMAFVPGEPFEAPAAATAPDYAKPEAWIARPDLKTDPSRWLPKGATLPKDRPVAVFYVPPTTYFSKAHWNAPINDADSREWLTLFTQSEASAFNGVGEVWAPRYRLATLGAFLTDKPDAQKAFDLAYGDVVRAFDAFLAQIPADRPILLAAHSQGSVHLMRLMHAKMADTPIAKRIVAAYLVGWPISVEADVPALGIPACANPGEANCLITWQSYAEPADQHQIRTIFESGKGYTGQPRKGTHMLCVNPLTGAQGATPALPTANRGSLIPDKAVKSFTFAASGVGARCDANGALLIGAPPEGYGSYIMPGNNYHVFDYALFWSNIRADAAARAKSFLAR
ncbi:DUF3089 domain-containing protein [Sphingomonas crocodyli]|uniref:DUF3089 domain-containing protein n=1 Tax=Sphingomonas crocodyli TaxID=1979270 RepID=A0A437M7W7_9SPHN|nr:DUF3089 domain-containing protein [Sphingomonas crocodyli]RVT93810.1 DUF3089 domain-containing protein [Sphingomonas crocodyli]